MKKVITICIACSFCFQAYNQNIYYDALKLKRWANMSAGVLPVDSLAAVLSNYMPARLADTSDQFATIRNFKLGNPFFAPYFNLGQPLSPIAFTSIINRLASSAGDLNVTNIADGLARFLIKRGKEELNMAFFSHFKKFLDDHEECKVLFPKTVDFLSKIEVSKYAAFLQSLRENFYTDLSNLIIHLNQFINLPKYDSLLQNHPEIKLAIGTANIVAELAQSGNSIPTDSVISQLATLPWRGVSKNVGTSFNFLNLISQSIREKDTSTHRSWVQLSELNKNLFTDSVSLRLYFGLLYQQVQQSNLTFYHGVDSIRVDTILAKHKDHIFTLSGLIENFSLLAKDVDRTIEDIKTKTTKGSITDDDYYTYINKAIEIIDYGFTMTATLQTVGINVDLSSFNKDKYIAVARNANDLYKNVYTKNYNDAVINVCTMLDSLIASESLKKLLPGLLKYGNFMASVVKAETPGEVEGAIEAAALPAGSSSIKKNTNWSVSLNAYIGGYFGRDVNNEDRIDGNASKVGVTAPVGIALSKGLGSYKNGSVIGSLSLFATLIDVGAIAGYRLSNDSTALESKLTLNDIFTPGGYLVYGFGLPFMSYVPLSVGYGWQYGSKLYTKTGTGTIAISNQSRWRSNWFIAIDIPLANFWTKNYRKKN